MDNSRHYQEKTRSYHNLDKAREKARKNDNYNSRFVRMQLTTVFEARSGFRPYPWQLDVAEAMLLGLDSTVIAGTGSGKTIPFMLPLLLDPTKKELVISPLKVLQDDQVSRYSKVGLAAAAVNGDTWNPQLKKDLVEGRFQGILSSPEMCLEHVEFRKVLTDHFDNITAIIIDEAHCISQWGGDFRTAYSMLGKLRAFFPPSIPILATSATLPPLALDEIRRQLGIDADDSFHLNLGNDRPNVAYTVHTMKAADDFETLKPFLTHTRTAPETADDFIKSIVFVNSVSTAQICTREIRHYIPPHLRKHVDYLYALRSPRGKRRAMKRFRDGEVKILIATEAAGMGADIPDISQVIQFGTPSSLSVWVQRAGRAGRDPSLNAHAILLVEQSMFQQQKAKRRRKIGETDAETQPAAEVDGHESENEPDGEDDDEPHAEESPAIDATVLVPGKEWKKSVEHYLRLWIQTKECRRNLLDEYFGNPGWTRKVPTHACCDICTTNHARAIVFPMPSSRPSTPEPASSNRSTPTNTPNGHGKRPMITTRPIEPVESTQKALPPRRGPHLEAARVSLNILRHRLKPRFMTVEAFMADSTWRTLSSARLDTIEDLEKAVTWVYAKRHGTAVLEALQRVDAFIAKEKQDKKDAEARRKAEEVAVREEEKRRVKELKAAEKRKKDEEKQQRDEEKRREKAAKELNKLAREAMRVAKKQKKENNPATLAASSPAFRIIQTPIRDPSSSAGLTSKPRPRPRPRPALTPTPLNQPLGPLASSPAVQWLSSPSSQFRLLFPEPRDPALPDDASASSIPSSGA